MTVDIDSRIDSVIETYDKKFIWNYWLKDPTLNYPKSTQLNFMEGTNDSEEAYKNTDKTTPWQKNFTETSITYTLNSKGYRGDEHDPKKYTVMIVGDSFVFGVGLDDKDCWVNQFKQLMS